VRTTSDLCGRVLDARYRMDKVVATGGMGTVYQGFDSRLERVVAVKVMREDLVYEPGFTDRFVTEARAAARLSDPHVVAVYDRGRTADAVYLVMEYVPGRTLRDVLLIAAWPVGLAVLLVADDVLGIGAADSYGDHPLANVLAYAAATVLFAIGLLRLGRQLGREPVAELATEPVRLT